MMTLGDLFLTCWLVAMATAVWVGTSDSYYCSSLRYLAFCAYVLPTNLVWKLV